jgi:hypothetical protein
MSEKHTLASIRNDLVVLQHQQTYEYALIKETLVEVSESIKPLNLIKSTFKSAIDSNEIRGGIISSVVNLTVGFFFRKFFIGGSHSPIKKLLGTALMLGTSKLLSKTGLVMEMENGIWNREYANREIKNEVDLELIPEKTP